jgi:glutamate racemase
MKAIQERLPGYDYLFYGDTAHIPYGDKTAKQIRKYTFA